MRHLEIDLLKNKTEESGKWKAWHLMSFSYGAVLQDADVPFDLKHTVYVHDLSCGEPVKFFLLCKIR